MIQASRSIRFFLHHLGAIACLGQPIKQRGFRLSDSENFLNSEQAQFKVNVKGPLDKGKTMLNN